MSTTSGRRSPVPKGLATQGKRLWRSIFDEYELDVHEQLVLVEACRVADRLDAIANELEGAPLTVTNHRGDEVAQPLYVEARQQSVVLTRLLASLRLPVGDSEAEMQRPQRRGGARGAYGIRGAV